MVRTLAEYGNGSVWAQVYTILCSQPPAEPRKRLPGVKDVQAPTSLLQEHATCLGFRVQGLGFEHATCLHTSQRAVVRVRSSLRSSGSSSSSSNR